jgi:hypothetical protein
MVPPARVELAQKPGLGASPVPADGLGRDVHLARDLLDREPAKETQLDDARLQRVDGLEGGEGIVERHQVG